MLSMVKPLPRPSEEDVVVLVEVVSFGVGDDGGDGVGDGGMAVVG